MPAAVADYMHPDRNRGRRCIGRSRYSCLLRQFVPLRIAPPQHPPEHRELAGAGLVPAERLGIGARRRPRRRGGQQRRTAAASPAGVFSAAIIPAAGACTTSALPGIGLATTGVPQAIASSSTLAQPSRLEASTSASAAP